MELGATGLGIARDVHTGSMQYRIPLTESQGKHIENAQAPFFSDQRKLATDVH